LQARPKLPTPEPRPDPPQGALNFRAQHGADGHQRRSATAGLDDGFVELPVEAALRRSRPLMARFLQALAIVLLVCVDSFAVPSPEYVLAAGSIGGPIQALRVRCRPHRRAAISPSAFSIKTGTNSKASPRSFHDMGAPAFRESYGRPWRQVGSSAPQERSASCNSTATADVLRVIAAPRVIVQPGFKSSNSNAPCEICEANLSICSVRWKRPSRGRTALMLRATYAQNCNANGPVVPGTQSTGLGRIIAPNRLFTLADIRPKVARRWNRPLSNAYAKILLARTLLAGDRRMERGSEGKKQARGRRGQEGSVGR